VVNVHAHQINPRRRSGDYHFFFSAIDSTKLMQHFGISVRLLAYKFRSITVNFLQFGQNARLEITKVFLKLI
jgi:hypothetical protein